MIRDFDFNLVLALTGLSGTAFIIYGLLILLTPHMKSEFKRYGFPQYRTLTGILETFGGIGSFIGLFIKEIYLLSTFGLFLLMFLGVITRLKIKDEFIKILPALILLLINAYLFFNRIKTD